MIKNKNKMSNRIFLFLLQRENLLNGLDNEEPNNRPLAVELLETFEQAMEEL